MLSSTALTPATVPATAFKASSRFSSLTHAPLLHPPWMFCTEPPRSLVPIITATYSGGGSVGNPPFCRRHSRCVVWSPEMAIARGSYSPNSRASSSGPFLYSFRFTPYDVPRHPSVMLSPSSTSRGLWVLASEASTLAKFFHSALCLASAGRGGTSLNSGMKCSCLMHNVPLLRSFVTCTAGACSVASTSAAAAVATAASAMTAAVAAAAPSLCGSEAPSPSLPPSLMRPLEGVACASPVPATPGAAPHLTSRMCAVGSSFCATL
mmetsp:Transcript_32350/g.79861  ORF Transcript_32350/g.79861 Transcript_32350/m.79861 type:complete len:265 (+) Transcript_32350:365-1159(+)